MTLVDVIFYFFAAVTIASAAVVVFSRNIIYSAFALLFTFFGVAGFYVLLGADFIAITQLLVYVGGILVLLVFGVMLTNKVVSVEMKTGTLNVGLAMVVVSVAAGTITGIFYATQWKVMPSGMALPTTAVELGKMLMTGYLLPFEVASVVLLVALIGAAMISRRDRKKESVA
ncbi:MAG TPA: NADH-quinone oxidoreductase subunit J [Bacteroidota bacterium]|nr:NADH-quinone oxidoreductase subunit J [Bacteroidota bacterium]